MKTEGERRTRRSLPTGIALAVGLAALTMLAEARTVVKLGTLAPEGSAWHDALLAMRQAWRRISDGELELRVYAGGVLGGEVEMIRKVRRRSLDAVALSGSSLPQVDRSVDCLNVPLFFASYEELDFVRAGIEAEIKARFEARRFTILDWGEAGWVHFFTTTPVTSPEELRQLRLWTAAGFPESEALFRDLGFRVVPLPATDMLTALQTGLIDAIDVPPLFALLDRSYQVARHMLDLPFAPVNAAILVSTPVWNKVSADRETALLEATRAAARGLRREVRRANQAAIDEMRGRGLNVVTPSEAAVADWHREASALHPQLGCAREFPGLFDRTRELRQTYRREHGG